MCHSFLTPYLKVKYDVHMGQMLTHQDKKILFKLELKVIWQINFIFHLIVINIHYLKLLNLYCHNIFISIICVINSNVVDIKFHPLAICECAAYTFYFYYRKLENLIFLMHINFISFFLKYLALDLLLHLVVVYNFNQILYALLSTFCLKVIKI